MKMLWRRRVLAAALSLTAAVGGLLVAGTADAQTVANGSFSFSGDPGDWVSGGQSYSYTTGNGDSVDVSSSTGSTVDVSVTGANGDLWFLDFDAPGTQVLAPGTYTGATRFPFNGDSPGLSLVGNGRGCNEVTGSFTIIDAVFGPLGYVQTFDATFEQHCEGADPAARGEIHISNPPPPPALELGLVVATDGTANTVNGNAEVHGTVSCTKATSVSVTGTLTQVNKALLTRGTYATQVACTPGTTVPWAATAIPNGLSAFVHGPAEAATRAEGFDTDYSTDVVQDTTTVVRLSRVKP